MKFNINFAKMFPWAFLISGAMIASVIVGYFSNGLNYGIDFAGGALVEFQTSASMNEIREKTTSSLSGDLHVQSQGKSIVIRTDTNTNVDGIKRAINEIDPNVVYLRIDSIGPKFSAELMSNGMVAMVWAIVGISLYIWARFQWRFGVCAVLALVHDCIAVLGLYTLFRCDFSEASILAMLVTLAYSVNDTVVIFDRVHKIREDNPGVNWFTVINKSLNITLMRTILTSLTTLVALVVLYIFGGYVIQEFSLPIIIGVVAGCYSSVFIAPSLLLLSIRNSDISLPK